ncbi:MAG: iron ABC transporter permease [Pseudomonadota bacterium]
MIGQSRHFVFEMAGMSFRVYRSSVWLLTLQCAALTMLSCLSLIQGDFPLKWTQLLSLLSNTPDTMAEFVVLDVRLPRLLAGLTAGAAFGLAGAVIQSLGGNDLASPDLIGFNAGAAIGAVLCIAVFGASGIFVAGGAVLGVLLTAALIGGLAWERNLNPNRFVLIGIGIGATLFALVEFLLTRIALFKADAAYRWMIGSISAPSDFEVMVGALAIGPLLAAAVLIEPYLDRLSLGVSVAASLGNVVRRIRIMAVVLGLLASATAVFIVGPVAFIAFVAGPVTRSVLNRGPALVHSSLTGSILLVFSDLVARTVMAPTQLPVGLCTALLGGPFLIWILTRNAKEITR